MDSFGPLGVNSMTFSTWFFRLPSSWLMDAVGRVDTLLSVDTLVLDEGFTVVELTKLG